MNWLNLNIQTLDSEEFLGSAPVDRATWLCLLRYCIGQENSGVVVDCKDWADRKWQQLVRVTKKEAERKCDLWEWDGDALRVWGYPADKENEVREKRDRAKTNGAKGGRPKTTKDAPHLETDMDQHLATDVGIRAVTGEKPTLVVSAKAEGERKGNEMEWEMEGKGTITPPGPPGGEVAALAEAIWRLCPRLGRERSSQSQLAAQLGKLPSMVLRDGGVILVSLKAWTLSESWTREDGRFVPGIHRWLKDGKWRSSPEPAGLRKGSFAGTQEDIDLPI